jgi:2-polyprenyl-6-methoxyphenol hydroxylase-like FAD-dependent oxidoreductase
MRNLNRIVIIGTGAAGLTTAESLRRLGFGGKIMIVHAENTPPYDRPPLSKQVLDPGLTNTFAERLSALSEEELRACVQGMSILSQALARESTLLSFTSHLTERVKPSKSEEPRSHE